MALEAETMSVCEKELHEPGAHFYLLLAYDADKNEVGRKRVGGRGQSPATTGFTQGDDGEFTQMSITWSDVG